MFFWAKLRFIHYEYFHTPFLCVVHQMLTSSCLSMLGGTAWGKRIVDSRELDAAVWIHCVVALSPYRNGLSGSSSNQFSSLHTFLDYSQSMTWLACATWSIISHSFYGICRKMADIINIQWEQIVNMCVFKTTLYEC